MNPDSELSAQLLLETCQFSDLNRHFLCCGRGKRKKKRLSGGLHAVTCLLSWDNKAGRSNLLPSCMAGLYHSPTCPVSYFWMRVPPLHSLPGALAWPSLASPCRNLDFLTAWLSQSTHCPFLAVKSTLSIWNSLCYGLVRVGKLCQPVAGNIRGCAFIK